MYVADNPQAVAFETISKLSKNSGIATATFVRLAQAMGFSGFSEMQALFRNEIRSAYPSSLAERISHSQGEEEVADPANIAGLARSFCRANIASLSHLADRIETMDLDLALEMMLEARVIYVMGADRSFATAAYLSYALNRVGLQSVQIIGLGSAIEDHATVMAEGDILVAISFPPYAQDTITVTETARRKGNDILAITNSPLSPVAKDAKHVLLVEDAELHGFRSLTAVMSLVQSLTIGLAYRVAKSSKNVRLDRINV